MLEQVLQQNASKPEAKSNQSQIQSHTTTRESSWHHSVAYVTASAPIPVKPRDEMMPGLDLIEHLDFHLEVACDEVGLGFCPDDPHGADWWVAHHCAGVIAVCHARIQNRLDVCRRSLSIQCAKCFEVYPARAFTVLGPIR